MLKRLFHKFVISERGAVSIYLIVVAMFLLLFNAVLIDYARIMVAERQTEEAAKTALRSTMASYSTSIQDKGLFGFYANTGDDADDIYQEVFEKNLVPQDEGQFFNLLGLEPNEKGTSLDLDFSRSLANPSILDYQILEEMKYKAPVEVGEALIEDFLSIAEQVEDASDQAEITSEVNSEAKDRESELDELVKKLTKAKSLIEDVDYDVQERGDSEYPNVNTLPDVIVHIDTYKEELEEVYEAEEEEKSDDEDDEEQENDENDEEDEDEEGEEEEKSIEEMDDDTAEFLEKSNNLLDDLIDTAEKSYDKLEEALELLDSAEGINIQIRQLIEDKTSNSDSYEDAKEASDELTEGDSGESGLEDYVMEDDFFTDIKEEINSAKACIDPEADPDSSSECSQGDGTSADGFVPILDQDFRDAIHYTPDEPSELIDDLDDVHSATTSVYVKVDDVIKEIPPMIEDERKEYVDKKDEIEEKEEEADEEVEDTTDTLNDIKDTIEAKGIIEDDIEAYNHLNSVIGDYGDAAEENAEEFDMDNADDAANESTSFVDGLFKNIGDALLGARDRVYINEYILLRFSSHNFEKSGVHEFAYENNQVEYILYGKTELGANFMLAMGEIATLRFIINLAAGFLDAKGNAFGPFKWAYALAKAAARTADDMRRIADGDPVELFPQSLWTKKDAFVPEMSYEDHLRLFLFAHPDGDTQERLMAALDEETKEDLNKRATYASAEASSSVDLWFLPQIADMMGKTGILDGEVKDGKYYIEKDINYSY